MILRGSIRWVLVAAPVILLPVRTTYGQTASGASLPEAAPDSTVVGRVSRLDSVYGAAPIQSKTDSLKLKLLDLDIAKAELELSRTDIWHRFMPEIRISANFGVQQLVFIDPTTFTLYTLPKDSYRLTVSLSLSDVLDGARHDNARLVRDKLKTEYMLRQSEYSQKYIERSRQCEQLTAEIRSLEEELALVQSILDYKQLLFDQGKANFDDLSKAQISLLHLKRTITELKVKRFMIEQN